MSTTENIRNFCIIAHIDHGKSTLADRLLEITGTIEKRQMKEQYLDQLESERERGITIKMAPVRMIYRQSVIASEVDQKSTERGNLFKRSSSSEEIASAIPRNDISDEYILNLIDTPGHSDFGYEVSRALAAVEGAILLVDVSQGIQAQTLANYENAKRAGLTIIGAVNKIDLDLSNTDEVVNDLANLIGVASGEILKVSGKTGEGVENLLMAVIGRVPPPSLRGSSNDNENDEAIFSSASGGLGDRHAPTVVGARDDVGRALIFDSLYDDHKGIIAFVRVFDGQFKRDDRVNFLATGDEIKIKEVGYFHPQLKSCPQLTAGEIGYIATGVKEFGKIKIGDTVVLRDKRQETGDKDLRLPGYKEPQSVVFVSFYPEESDDYENLKQALSKLKLTDAALTFEPDTSEMLGRGFKGGFLGRLHFEITAERLEKEFHIRTVHSFPSVAYRVRIKNPAPEGRGSPNEIGRQELRIKEDDFIAISNPKDFPDDYLEAQEPIVKIEILTPNKYLGGIFTFSEIFRLTDIQTSNLGTEKILVTAKLPLADLISDFDDKLKSLSAGYASLSYEIIGYEKGELEKMEILVAGHVVPGLTRILPKEKVNYEARQTVERLRELLPKQQFVQAIQASVRGKIIARETIAAMRKDVTGYLYGGDRTRKMKLWKKQQKGKAKLKERVEQGPSSQVRIPASIFKELLKK